MKRKEGFVLRKVCGEQIIVAEGKENIDFTSIVSMNESSAFLWRSIQDKDFTVEDLADLLIGEYMIDENTPLDRETALADAKTVLEKWIEADLVEK